MNYLLFFISLLFSTVLLAQEDHPKKKKNSINITSSIAIGYRFQGAKYDALKKRETEEYIRIIDEDRGASITANYRFGWDYQREFIKGFAVRIGFSLASWEITTTNYFSANNPVTRVPYLFLELPLTLQYKFGNKKLQPYIEIGTSPLMSLNKPSQGCLVTDVPPSISFAFYTGVGLSYQLSPKFALLVQISSRFQTINEEYGLFPAQIGAEFGTAFLF